MDQVKVGEFISTARKEKRMTQKELAEQIGVSDKTISRWETGNGLPDMAYLTPLCDFLGVSVNELLSGEKLPPAYSQGIETQQQITKHKDDVKARYVDPSKL